MNLSFHKNKSDFAGTFQLNCILPTFNRHFMLFITIYEFSAATNLIGKTINRKLSLSANCFQLQYLTGHTRR